MHSNYDNNLPRNYSEKKAICCEMQCAHRPEKLTGYKTIP